MKTKKEHSEHRDGGDGDGDADSHTSLAPLSVEEALSALLKIPDPEKAIKDADAMSRKGRSKG